MNIENDLSCIARYLQNFPISILEENAEICKVIMNESPPDPYYVVYPPYDIYTNSSHLLTIHINHVQWEQNTSMIVDMALNAPSTSTFITGKSIKYTNIFFTRFIDTYFPINYN